MAQNSDPQFTDEAVGRIGEMIRGHLDGTGTPGALVGAPMRSPSRSCSRAALAEAPR